jgi:hypothetical protein
MGVSTNFYTIHGIKIAWDDVFSDMYNEVYDDEDTPYVLIDGMSGEYMIFGTVLFDSGDARWGFEDGDSYKEIDLCELTIHENEYKESFNEKFSQFSHYMDQPFKLMTITHYS